jgi:DNA-binding CsgD family transcriptional regulator
VRVEGVVLVVRNFTLNSERLVAVSNNLGDAIVDPGLWPQIMDEISAAVGATGAALVQSDVRTPDIPRTASVDDCFKHYFATGWQAHDTRAERGEPLLMRGRAVITDQDIVTPEEMRRLDFYNECALPFGVPWFAGIGLRAGPAFWVMVILRSERQGPFEPHETRLLASLAPRLTQAATLSRAVGQVTLSGITNALALVGQPALALDRSGFVLDANAVAQQIFDDEIFVRNRRLKVRDKQASSALRALADRIRTARDTAPLLVPPIVVRRMEREPLVIRVLPVAAPARTPFLGARALLVISDLHNRPRPQPCVLAETFGLTPAEARLASIMAAGISIERAADQLGLARVTVRNQLKAVFAKTATHRQGELIALLSRL